MQLRATFELAILLTTPTAQTLQDGMENFPVHYDTTVWVDALA